MTEIPYQEMVAVEVQDPVESWKKRKNLVLMVADADIQEIVAGMVIEVTANLSNPMVMVTETVKLEMVKDTEKLATVKAAVGHLFLVTEVVDEVVEVAPHSSEVMEGVVVGRSFLVMGVVGTVAIQMTVAAAADAADVDLAFDFDLADFADTEGDLAGVLVDALADVLGDALEEALGDVLVDALAGVLGLNRQWNVADTAYTRILATLLY